MSMSRPSGPTPSWRRLPPWRGAVATVAAVFTGLLVLGVAEPASAARRTARLYLVHALIGYPADVLVDGRREGTAVTPATVIGPLTVGAGGHLVTWSAGGKVLVEAKITVQAGTSLDVVAHPTDVADAAPAVTTYVNRGTAITRGKSRLIVTDVAAAPPADVALDGKVLSRGVVNGQSLEVDVPGRTFTLTATPALLGGAAILDGTAIKATPGTLTRVFIAGDPTAGSATAIVQRLTLAQIGAAAPVAVHTGDAGLAATQPGLPWPVWFAAGLVVVLIIAGSGTIGGRRRATVAMGRRIVR
jgi:hypothetical protein